MKSKLSQWISILLVLLAACIAATAEAEGVSGLPDGVYAPDSFSWSGGSGRVSITCDKVTISGGSAEATIVFSSSSYGYVRVGDEIYYGDHDAETSTFEIPVVLNSSNKIVGMTTKMSSDHEIEYTIYVGLGAESDGNGLVGLKWESDDALDSAELFSIHRYEGGFVAIEVAGAAQYLLVPEGAEAPAGLEESAVLMQMPVQRAYMASEGALELLDLLPSGGPMKAVSAAGFGKDDCPSEGLARQMADGEIVFAGRADAPDYAAMLKAACDLAVLPGGTSLPEVTERLELLGIPAFVDRAAEESTEQGRLEWLKVYGAIFGCEEQAGEVYAQMKGD
ncbi:MAG: ABC transporter substrate-binding protein [Candidatus Faecivicinus sp.]